MKRVLWLLAAAAITITACNKPQYIIPIDDEDEEEQQNPDEGFKEKTFVVNITLKAGVNNNYSGTVGTMPGNEILDFLNLTKEEFYKGMGSTTTGSMTSAQSNNTIMFGVMLELGITRLPEEAFKKALEANFAKKPKLIPMNLEILEFARKWVRENV